MFPYNNDNNNNNQYFRRKEPRVRQGPFVDYEWHYSCLDDELLPDTPGNLVWRAYNVADQKQLEEAYQNDDSTFVLIPSARRQTLLLPH